MVFVTAFDEHTLRAFNIHALDTLLKSFAPSRLRRQLAPPAPSWATALAGSEDAAARAASSRAGILRGAVRGCG